MIELNEAAMRAAFESAYSSGYTPYENCRRDVFRAMSRRFGGAV